MNNMPKKYLTFVVAGILIGLSSAQLVELMWGYPEPYLGAPFSQIAPATSTTITCGTGFHYDPIIGYCWENPAPTSTDTESDGCEYGAEPGNSGECKQPDGFPWFSDNTESGQVNNGCLRLGSIECPPDNPAPQIAPTTTEICNGIVFGGTLCAGTVTVPAAPTSTIIPTVYDHCEDMNASDCISAYESSYAPFIVETSSYFDIIHSYVASTSMEYTDVIAKQNGQLSIPLSTSSEVYIFRLNCNGTLLANIQDTLGYLDGVYPFNVSKCDELHVSSILPRQQPTSTEWNCSDAPTYIGQGFSPSIKTYKEFLPNGSELYFTFNTFGTSTPESEGYSDCTQIN